MRMARSGGVPSANALASFYCQPAGRRATLFLWEALTLDEMIAYRVAPHLPLPPGPPGGILLRPDR